MNYRNKTIFDWNDFKINKISSIISLQLMEILKKEITDLPIKNVIIRDINNQIGIIIQINMDKYKKEDGIMYYELINKITTELDYELQIFAIQFMNNKKFETNKNIIYYKKKIIIFDVDYVDNKKICLLPDSFYQANIGILYKFYDNFKRWIKQTRCTNMINLGDDGGNVCTILSSLFLNMISYFHCDSSIECAQEMIKLNDILNLNITKEIRDIIVFEKLFDNLILFINPGRKGLRTNEIDFINESSNIKYMIYMACNKTAFEKNKKSITKKIDIRECVEILNMPVINKYQFLYHIKIYC